MTTWQQIDKVRMIQLHGSGRVEGRMVLATFLVIARSRMEVLISENVVIYNTFVHALTIKVFNGFILAS